MSGNERHYFPGNNTPGGFFSYYRYVIDQKEARKTWCLKGGPGTGKSRFMKEIGETLLLEGHDVDFLHCSSDSHSFDGILLPGFGISIVDGTAPHAIDPVNPGAVDIMINLGDYWDEEAIRKNRMEIIETKEAITGIFKRVYNYLGAAEKMYDDLSLSSERSKSENYSIAKSIIDKEIEGRHISKRGGRIKRFFAGAITPEGLVNYLPGLIGSCRSVYVINAGIGCGSRSVVSYILDDAINRGLDAEVFYCSMKPESKPEHLIIRELSLAVISSNKYHCYKPPGTEKDITVIDLQEQHDKYGVFLYSEARDSLEMMDELLGKAVFYLGEAKKKHDILENYYAPNMDFNKIEELRLRVLDEIRKMINN